MNQLGRLAAKRENTVLEIIVNNNGKITYQQLVDEICILMPKHIINTTIEDLVTYEYIYEEASIMPENMKIIITAKGKLAMI